jgi:hypothetical protein
MSENSTHEEEEELDPNDFGFDFDPKKDDKTWPIKATPADLALPAREMDAPAASEIDEMTGKANLGLGYVEQFDPSRKRNKFEWLDSAVNKVHPLDVTFAPPTGPSIIEHARRFKFNPSNADLTPKQSSFVIKTGEMVQPLLPTLPPKRASVSARPPPKASYYRKPPTQRRGGASKKTKKSRRMRRVKTQMRRKNSSRKSTRRRTRK